MELEMAGESAAHSAAHSTAHSTAHSAAHEGGPRRRPTKAAVCRCDSRLTGFKGIRSGPGRQRLRRLCAKPTTGRGRFQTVAQAA